MREVLQTRNRAFGPNGVPTTSRQTSATRTDTTSRLPISLGSTNKRYEPSTHLRPAMTKHLALSPSEAADRLAIRELVDAYAHCADRRDAKGQMALFTEDTHFVVYMDARNPEPTQDLHGREALAPVFDALNAYVATMHFNGQSTVELDGDRATGESYCLAHHLTVRVRWSRPQVAEHELGHLAAELLAGHEVDHGVLPGEEPAECCLVGGRLEAVEGPGDAWISVRCHGQLLVVAVEGAKDGCRCFADGRVRAGIGRIGRGDREREPRWVAGNAGVADRVAELDRGDRGRHQVVVFRVVQRDGGVG